MFRKWRWESDRSLIDECVDIKIVENEVHMRKLWPFEVEMKVCCYFKKSQRKSNSMVKFCLSQCGVVFTTAQNGNELQRQASEYRYMWQPGMTRGYVRFSLTTTMSPLNHCVAVAQHINSFVLCHFRDFCTHERRCFSRSVFDRL